MMTRTYEDFMSPTPKKPPDSNQADAPSRAQTAGGNSRNIALRIVLWLGLAGLAAVASVLLAVALAMALAYPNLPDVSDLSEYHPKLPLRVFTAEGTLIGEFGEERRHFTPIKSIPQTMTNAVLAIEDARFFQHGGVDYLGILRAGLANVGKVKSQGASTITMQVARNVYLSSEKTYTRKIYEILLTFKLEHLLTKNQILEIYMNQIYLGNRAYGFAAAAETYFGKQLKELSIAEAAMLAGLPKAPSAYNPISNPKRARSRQLYIIERMLDNGYINAAEAEAAKKEELKLKSSATMQARTHADFVAEMVRQQIHAQYGDEAYTLGLQVFTTLESNEQAAAYRELSLLLRREVGDLEHVASLGFRGEALPSIGSVSTARIVSPSLIGAANCLERPRKAITPSESMSVRYLRPFNCAGSLFSFAASAKRA